ncbi:septum site-determining protein MinC [Vulcanococcus limneticus Candia 3F8]|uniref:septum site-determining protein MinC n=1 Tax=Vulcanococcus limneticus TaxID=2170428 RepID=UPI000B993222|nr:septum site-determining protein MinC [Vulcanococcus limneticus]MCP9791328.1 septum site-determining protein MinC [Vulcanococcus limneticus MW73D5]MCP9893067.1 septum site-determining protein MinC [Vulcanococcus limneticus Candia 3F8]MCP9896795.1 septum site-determining protein MinC [Vulcanococcus limneticus Candia 3B3]
MAALLTPAPAPGLPHQLQLPINNSAGNGVLAEVRHGLGSRPPRGPLVLHSRDWPLTLPELRALQQLLEGLGLTLERVEGSRAETLVAAAALGLATGWRAEPDGEAEAEAGGERDRPAPPVTIHQGTLRSGDHLQAEGSVLLLGDVNPGARISAVGDVRVWGRLRGVAHAGCRGDGSARIVALQLRPLQLRIAAAVARGPEDQPPTGFTEEAVLEGGAIAIRPAEPSWPLNG